MAGADATVARADASPGVPLRLGFAGTPAFAARILTALIDADRAPVAVYTQPDRPVGRGRKVRPSPVKVLAESHGLPVHQPESLAAAETIATLAALELDVLVVAAYGLLLPRGVLDTPRLGCINVHPSLLPRWRGAAPIERTILAGDRESGVCIMRMDEGLDTGPVYLCRRRRLPDDVDTPALEAMLGDLGAGALLECLADLPQRVPTPQPTAGATYARKLEREDAIVHWSAPAIHIERQVRALASRMPPLARAGDARVRLLAARASDAAADAEPGTLIEAGRDALTVACGSGRLRLFGLKLDVGKGGTLTAADAINGYAHLFHPGARLRDGDAPP
ncbi:MAG: methionyl-tRNA formyltransferase [Pseudomonadota bacterium]